MDKKKLWLLVAGVAAVILICVVIGCLLGGTGAENKAEGTNTGDAVSTTANTGDEAADRTEGSASGATTEAVDPVLPEDKAGTTIDGTEETEAEASDSSGSSSETGVVPDDEDIVIPIGTDEDTSDSSESTESTEEKSGAVPGQTISFDDLLDAAG